MLNGWALILTLLTVLGVPARGAESTAGPPPLIVLEQAPKELGQVTATGDLLLTTSPRGKEVWLFAQAEQVVWRFSEQGIAWGDPIELSAHGLQAGPRVSRFATDGGSLAFAGPAGVYIYSLDGQPQGSERIFQPGDIIAGRNSTWLVSLTNLPHPSIPGRYFGRKSYGAKVPRLIVLSGKELKIGATGLYESEGISPSAGVGRRLRMTQAGDQFYAAEHANYRVYQLNKKLEVTGLYRDPKLLLEEGRGAGGSEQDSQDPLPSAALQEALADRGQDATRPESAATRKTSRVQVRIAAEPVIRDIGWDSASQRLVVLLNRDTAAEHFYVLDALDPLTGTIQRIRIALPKGVADISLTQLSVGHHYIWLRGYKGGTATWRLDKSTLERGLASDLLEVIAGGVKATKEAKWEAEKEPDGKIDPPRQDVMLPIPP